MMSNEEMVQRVFERSDEYFRKKEKQRAIIKKGGTIMSITGIIIAASLAILSANTQNVVPPEEPSRIDVVGTMQSSTETTASTTATIASSAYGSESNENNTETTSITTTAETTTYTAKTYATVTTTASSSVKSTAASDATTEEQETTAVTTTPTETDTTTITEETVAETGIILTIDTVEVTPGELAANNNCVFVNISIKNNTKFSGIMCSIDFDERLELQDSDVSGILLDDGLKLLDSDQSGHISFIATMNKNTTTDETDYCEEDGVFWTLCLKLPEDAAAGDEYSVSFAENEFMDMTMLTCDESYVFPTLIDGKITVVEVTRGDVNGDGEVNIYDAAGVLTIYASMVAGKEEYSNISVADVNRDGMVNTVDAQMILYFYAQYSAGLLDDWFDDLLEDW